MCCNIYRFALILVIVSLFSSCFKINKNLNKSSLDEYFNIRFDNFNKIEKKLILDFLIEDLWKEYKSQSEKVMKNNLDLLHDTNVLYNFQVYTTNFLFWSIENKRYGLIEEIIDLVNITFKSLTVHKHLCLKYSSRVDTVFLNRDYEIWINGIENTENYLHSSQYCYFLAMTLNAIEKSPYSFRKKEKIAAYKKRVSKILFDHYTRWVLTSKNFQLIGWGCDSEYYNHKTFIKKQLEFSFPRVFSYCHAITDWDLWIMAGVADFMALNIRNPKDFPIDEHIKNAFLEYLEICEKVLESRTKITEVRDFENHIIEGRNFDPGMWDDHPGHKYSSYLEKSFPKENQVIRSPKGTSWDISHASRFYYVFSSFYNNRKLLGLTYPDEKAMYGFSNQVAYVIFNKNFNEPKFNNFFDGNNGWYNLKIHDNFGYSPYSLSVAYIYGGYPLWGKYNKDVNKITESVFNYIYIKKSNNDAYNTIPIFLENKMLNYNTIRDNLQFFTAYSINL